MTVLPLPPRNPLTDLTPRQREIARLVGEGLTTKRIGAVLGIAARTVNIHITAIAFQIGADAEKDERVQVAMWWWEERARDAA